MSKVDVKVKVATAAKLSGENAATPEAAETLR